MARLFTSGANKTNLVSIPCDALPIGGKSGILIYQFKLGKGEAPIG